jgi:hypothetical protein
MYELFCCELFRTDGQTDILRTEAKFKLRPSLTSLVASYDEYIDLSIP